MARMPHLVRSLSLALAASLVVACASAADGKQAKAPEGSMVTNATGVTLDAVIGGSWRTPKNVLRDQYRHPKETLSFFLVNPDKTVIEITPGGGWYTEILAPYLRDDGHYIAATWDDDIGGQPKYRYEENKELRAKIASNNQMYGKVETRVFDASKPAFGPDDSADVVLTFRNVHNWAADGTAEAMFKAMFAVLKPGGVLGVEDHRADAGKKLDDVVNSGYLPTDYVIKLATDAGFKLDAQSEINANPKDDHNHPKGVWTLPPSFDMGDTDKAKWQAIGESDRMTLRFVKPAAAK